MDVAELSGPCKEESVPVFDPRDTLLGVALPVVSTVPEVSLLFGPRSVESEVSVVSELPESPELDVDPGDVSPPPELLLAGGGGATLLTLTPSVVCVLAPAAVVARAVNVYPPFPTDVVSQATEQLVVLVQVLSTVLPALSLILLMLPGETLVLAATVAEPLKLAPLLGAVKCTDGAGTVQVMTITPAPDAFELSRTPKHRP